MPIINLTEWTVRLADENGEVYTTFEPAERNLTVHTKGDEIEVDGTPLEVTQVTSIEGLPQPEDGTYYIVPEPVVMLLNRSDLVAPDTGPSAIRNNDGSVHAVRRLYSIADLSEQAHTEQRDTSRQDE